MITSGSEKDPQGIDEHQPEAVLSRCIPVERRADGADPDVLRRVREYDPNLVLMWDGKLQLVAVFERLPGQAMPRFVGWDHHGQGRVDLPMVSRLIGWDLYKTGGLKGLLQKMAKEQREESPEAKEAIRRDIDHDAAYVVCQRIMTALDGMPRHLRMAVPSSYKVNPFTTTPSGGEG